MLFFNTFCNITSWYSHLYICYDKSCKSHSGIQDLNSLLYQSLFFLVISPNDFINTEYILLGFQLFRFVKAPLYLLVVEIL